MRNSIPDKVTHYIRQSEPGLPALPAFEDLPWDLPLEDWRYHCDRVVEVERGLSRHTVIFINYDGFIYALKELPHGAAQREYEILLAAESRGLPVVAPIGYTQLAWETPSPSVLITRYLEGSLPYRTLFMRPGLESYRQHLLDAMAGLLVQLHLSGLFWGDCSLSNTLFRRDAGALRAYLVDAEFSDLQNGRLPPELRHQEIQIMECNVTGDLMDLASCKALPDDFPVYETGETIRLRYHNLWAEITRQEVIHPSETYRIQERIRALNTLGFSVGELVMEPSQEGNFVRFHVIVTDRNFHRNQLLEFTGLEVEEAQARVMMNEIQEVRGYLSQQQQQHIPLSVAAYHWLEYHYQPVLARLELLIEQRRQADLESQQALSHDPAELYCQVLEHKWYLSERAQQDVGHAAAVQDYLQSVVKDLHLREG